MLWLTNEITRYFYVKEYEQVEKLIIQLEGKLDDSVEVNKRYLNFIKAELQYYKGNLDSISYSKEVENSLSHGGMSLDEMLGRKWPFEEMECNRILSLVEMVRKEQDYDRQKKLLEHLLELLETGYMESGYNDVYKIIARCRMGDVLGNMGFHRNAIAMDEETIKLCDERQNRHFLPKLYYDIFWNFMMISKKKTLTQQEEAYRKECLLKAYYYGLAIYPDNALYERRVKEYYPDELD